MDSLKTNMLQLLSDTGYVLNLKSTELNFVESPVTCWFNLNISEDNCITEEELTEFQSLQDSGEVLYGEELEEALQEHYNAGATVPVNEAVQDIKHYELEHAQHQLDLQKQLLLALRSNLYSLENNYCELQQCFQKAEDKKMCVLKSLTAVDTEFNSKLNTLKGTLKKLVEDITELAPKQECSADEGIDTYSSDRLKSSTLSNSSFMSTMCSASTDKMVNNKYLCEMSFHKYNKQHTRFCKLLKDLLLKRLSKMQKDGSTPHSQLLIKNAMDRLFHQKMIYTKLISQLAGINSARTEVKKTIGEIQCQSWRPTQSQLRIKISDLEESSYLNESGIIFSEEEELSGLCWKWADLQILRPICDRLKEKIEWDQVMLTKLDELVSIMRVKLATDMQLCEVLHLEHDLVANIINMYNQVRDWVAQRLEATRSRLNLMKENLQDYSDNAISPRWDLIECLSSALGCVRTEIPKAYNLLIEQSQHHHRDTVNSYYQELQILASVHKNLKELYLEEEETRLSRLRMTSSKQHWDSLKETLELINCNIGNATTLCHTLLENKENVIRNGRI